MNYIVIWIAAAEQELAALWMDSAQRAAVTRAADAVAEWTSAGIAACMTKYNGK